MTLEHSFQALQRLGAGDFAHLDGSLIDHLSGTRQLLLAWGARPALADAGLFHAAYGTAGFDQALVGFDGRARIADLIGAEAEAIVYHYCACDRDQTWPRIGREAPVPFSDRFTGSTFPLAAGLLGDFCELTVANELEIAIRDAAFVARHGAELGELFVRFTPFISAGARSAVRRLLYV
jgi:hypothetical protein